MPDSRNTLSADYRSPETQGEQVVEPPPNARQGVTDHDVRCVLAVSFGLAVVILAVVYLIYFGYIVF